MSQIEQGQVVASAAEVYEEFFVPALFQEWTGPVAEASRLKPGQRVLDVACGTGILARDIVERVGPAGAVTGLDINEGMLAVARQKSTDVTWQTGPVEDMPFDDNSFDAVVSQFGLMFFADRRAAVAEMVRVLRPGGRLAVAVWDSLDNTPGYAAMTGLLERLFGAETAAALEAPFILGDTDELRLLFDHPALTELEVVTHVGTARFDSLEAWVTTDVKGWTLADMIDEAQFQRLLAEAKSELRPFVTDSGSVAFDSPAHIVSATKMVRGA